MGDVNCLQAICMHSKVSVIWHAYYIAKVAWAFGTDDVMMRNCIFATSGRNVGIRPHR